MMVRPTHMFDVLEIATAAEDWEVLDVLHGKAGVEEVADPAFEVKTILFVEGIVSFGIGLLASSKYGWIHPIFRRAFS